MADDKNLELAELLYPHIKTLPEDMEKRYPPRNLPEGAKVTRFAPSPTGFIHLGNIYSALIDERLAHQSDGVFYLRIEDTDSKREVEGGTELIIDMLAKYGIHFDEGATKDGDKGDYGPYRQSQRREIYQTYAKQLVREGKAYPCFCTHEELDRIREEQTAQKLTPGYYGKWAKWRDADIEQIKAELAKGTPFVLRLRSEGVEGKSFKFTDLVKGTIDVSENFIDHVILKSNGIPDYHFAHAVDDHLMRTTHVVRDESWLPSLPLHIELFRALGHKMPKYVHTAQVLKIDEETGKKRKLSKRKDPEFGLEYFYRSGYPVIVTIEYLMTLLNSNYEEWRMKHPDSHYTEFPFSIKKLSPSGCLFDFDKLNDIGREIISRMTADEVYKEVTDWAADHDRELYEELARDPDYAKAIFAIGRGGKKPRKDFAKWSDVKPYLSFFYDRFFNVEEKIEGSFETADIRRALERFMESYDESDDRTVWFDKLKVIASELGYAPEVKLYRQSPESYGGHVGDIAMFLRVAVTGRVNSPDLYDIMQLLGKERVIARVREFVSSLD
ncbi:MAG: glutamate--tRNA ligase [Eubacteriales bacterium]|jgi:glutamyl-tRNA synthetase|nr:glutamate--tRNA ligase [Clostridiales bacterium]